MAGFNDEQILELRQATIADTKLGAITRLTREIVQKQGRPDQRFVDDFFAAGFDNAALVDLIGLITVKLFSNYIHNLTQIPVDFPAAQPLPIAATV